MPNTEDFANALRHVHTPESFGRAIIDAALRSAIDNDIDELTMTVKLASSQPDGSVPVCFFLLQHEICVNIPVV